MKLEALGAGLDPQHLGIAPRLGLSEAVAPALRRAIEQESVVVFEYRTPRHETATERRVAPLRLHRAAGRWHLIAYDLEREDDRVFLLSRIGGDVRVLSRGYDPVLKDRADRTVDELLRLQRDRRVTVLVRPGTSAAARFRGRAEATGGSAGPAEHSSLPGAEGQERIEFGTLDYPLLAEEIAGFGDQLAVEEPAELRGLVTGLLLRVRDDHAQAAATGAPAVGRDAAQSSAGRGRSARRAPALRTQERVVLLLSLVPYLVEHGEVKVSRLAEVFEVDSALLRELIAFLGTAGIPGETSTYQDEDLFDIDWDAFEREDLVRLTRIIAVDDAPRFSAAEQAALLAGLHALTPLLPESELEHAASAAAKLAAAADPDGSAPTLSVTADAADPVVAGLAASVEERRRIGFVYRDLHGTATRRVVEPIALFQGDAGWYLRAYCLDRAADRTFLVDAMSDIRVLAERAEHRPAEVPALSDIVPSELPILAHARVRVGGTGSDPMRSISAFSPRAVGPVEHGELPVEIGLAHLHAAVRLVQSAPGAVVVTAPAEAVSRVREWAERVLTRYGIE
nr:WYL domain-containing protein [Leucobacter weissii]